MAIWNDIPLLDTVFVAMYIGVMCIALYKKERRSISIACGLAMLMHMFLAASVDVFTEVTAWQYYFITALINTILLSFIVSLDHEEKYNRLMLIPISFLAAIPYLRALEMYFLGMGSELYNLFNYIYIIGVPISHGCLILTLFNGGEGGRRSRVIKQYSEPITNPLYKHIATSLARRGSDYTYQKCLEENKSARG